MESEQAEFHIGYSFWITINENKSGPGQIVQLWRRGVDLGGGWQDDRYYSKLTEIEEAYS